MSKISIVEEIIKEHNKKALLEGVKFGKKELENVILESNKFNIGIEYEMLPPVTFDDNSNSHIQQTMEWIKANNIKNIREVINEEHEMVEVITRTMEMSEGIEHIENFLKIATRDGFEFPTFAGMHVSISLKNTNYDLNKLKFLILMSGDFIEKHFPTRVHTDNVQFIVKKLISEYFDSNDKFDVKAIENKLNDDVFLNDKYTGINVGDYFKFNGRIELRFIGGGAYNERFDEMKWNILRAAYLLGIAYEETMFKNEYTKALYKVWNDAFDPTITIKNKILNNEMIDPSWDLKPIQHMNKEQIIEITSLIESNFSKLTEYKAKSITKGYLKYIPKRYKIFAKRIFMRYLDHVKPENLEEFRKHFATKFPFVISASKMQYLENIKTRGLIAHDPKLVSEHGRVEEVEKYVMNEMDSEEAVAFSLHYAFSAHNKNENIVEDFVIPIVNKEPMTLMLVLTREFVNSLTSRGNGINILKSILKSDKSNESVRKAIIMGVVKSKRAVASIIMYDLEPYKEIFSKEKYLEYLNYVIAYQMNDYSDNEEMLEDIIRKRSSELEEIIDNGIELETSSKIILQKHPDQLSNKIKNHISD